MGLNDTLMASYELNCQKMSIWGKLILRDKFEGQIELYSKKYWDSEIVEIKELRHKNVIIPKKKKGQQLTERERKGKHR